MSDPMTIIGAVAAIVTIGVEVMALVSGAVWVVQKVQLTTATLTAEISHLATAVDKLHLTTTEMHDDVSDIQSRVAVLEAKRCEGCN